MDSVALKQEDLVQWAVGESPFPGQTVSGDGHLVAAFPGGVLLAVIDGLGHCAEAAAATTAALSALGANVGKPVVRLMEASHEALRQTRGAAISLGSLNARDHSLTWLGVGNVEAAVIRRYENVSRVRQSIMLLSGVVGHQLPPLHATVIQLEPLDLLVFFTDGINRDFLSEPTDATSPELIANRIFRKYRRRTDDALVLVARLAERGWHTPLYMQELADLSR